LTIFLKRGSFTKEIQYEPQKTSAMSEKLFVNHKPISLFRDFEKEYGKLKPSSPNTISRRITAFTINDIEAIRCPENFMSGNEFCFFLDANGYTPLDVFQARALYPNSGNHTGLQTFSKKFVWEKDFSLKNIGFFGSFLTDDVRKYIPCFKFDPNYLTPLFIAYKEDENSWSRYGDIALVFNKQFIKKVLEKERTKK